jgi:DNA mismatch repair protein MutS
MPPATPMMQQYQQAKRQHPDTLLLFRMGDFYELFHDDAVAASRLLGLTLTSRDKQVPMAGFPHHALEPQLKKLIEAGQRVAICEQVEDPAEAKGLVKREVIRVVSAGTLTEDALLDPRKANHLAAVVLEGSKAGLAWVELSTGQFQAFDLPALRIADELTRLDVAELLWPEAQPQLLLERLRVALPRFSLTLRPDWHYKSDSSRDALQEHFGVRTLEGFGFDDEALCLAAAGALLRYLKDMVKSSLAHLNRLTPYHAEERLLLDAATRRGLELTRTQREDRRDGSLLSSLDRTITSMGARLLQQWLFSPLLAVEPINARLDAVAELKEQAALRRDLRDGLRELPDLARLTTRASTGRATPRDLAAIGLALGLVPILKDALGMARATLLVQLADRLAPCPDLRGALARALVQSPPQSPKDGGVIRPGFHAELDHLRDTARGGKEWIAQFQAAEIERTGINSLKVGFNQVFGYYIEVTHTHAAKVPADYQRKQTLKNAERYITPELKHYEDQVLRAEERSRQLEYELFLQLRDQAAAQAGDLLQTADALAALDVLLALAETAECGNYCRPVVTDELETHLVAARHPVLEQALPAGTFVPNDTHLSPEDGTFWLITGPNMAGKSTYIRQTALLTILAQMGSFVPAASARIGLVDRIFTRIGAGDDLSAGQSTFMVEMAETANILNNATPRSLVILDEVGRGTSTYDGLALAWAIVEHLHDQIGCRALFATHYHELTQLSHTLPRLRNANVEVHEDQGAVTFLHRIAPGPANQSYGIHVAKLAGVPPPVLDRAQQVLEQLERQYEQAALATESRRRRKAKNEASFPTLFEEGRAR